jgi:hypothetical protein
VCITRSSISIKVTNEASWDKISSNDVKEPIYRLAVGKIVLGHYPEYLSLAVEIGAGTFNLPQEEWQKLDDAARWAANRKFPDDAIQRDDEIVLSTTDVKPGSWFERELRYLASKGYEPASSGGRTVLIRTSEI